MKDWKQTTLGEVAEVQTGPFGSQLHNEDYVADGTPIITVENLVNDYINDSENTPKVSDEDKTRLVRYTLRKGDVVFSRVGSVDRCGYVSAKEDGWLFSGRLLRVRPTEDVFHKYVFYWLSQQRVKEYVRRIAVGATMPSINTELLSQVPIAYPCVSEQKAIAAVLSSFDDKIELLRRQNKTLEKIAQTIFKEWFVNFTVNGKKLKINNATGLPEGWRMGKMGDEFEIIMGQSPDGRSYNEKGEGMIFFQGRAEFQDRFPTIRLYTTKPQKTAEKFDVLVSVRAPVGDINVAFDRCCIGRGLAAVRGKYKSYTLYKIKYLKGAFNKFEAEGTVFGSIGKDAFANIETIIPDSESVKEFEATASIIDGKIYNNNSQIQTLSKLRDTLLPKLMKGEIRVKGMMKLRGDRL